MTEKQSKSIPAVIKSFFTGEEFADKKEKRKFLLIFLVAGIVMMLAGPLISLQKTGNDGDAGEFSETTAHKLCYSSEQEKIERKLQQVLSNMDGVSDVHIFINFATRGEFQYAQDMEEVKRETVETDREGGTREIYETNQKYEHVLSRDSGGEKTVLSAEKMPQVKGVLIVAGGLGDYATQIRIVRAIQNVMDLPAHRIAVLPCSSR